MNSGKYVFAQILQFVNRYEFEKCVTRYKGDHRVTRFKLLESVHSTFLWSTNLKELIKGYLFMSEGP